MKDKNKELLYFGKKVAKGKMTNAKVATIRGAKLGEVIGKRALPYVLSSALCITAHTALIASPFATSIPAIISIERTIDEDGNIYDEGALLPRTFANLAELDEESIEFHGKWEKSGNDLYSREKGEYKTSKEKKIAELVLEDELTFEQIYKLMEGHMTSVYEFKKIIERENLEEINNMEIVISFNDVYNDTKIKLNSKDRANLFFSLILFLFATNTLTIFSKSIYYLIHQKMPKSLKSEINRINEEYKYYDYSFDKIKFRKLLSDRIKKIKK